MNAKKIMWKTMEYVNCVMIFTNMENVLFVIRIKIMKSLIMDNAIVNKIEFEVKQVQIVYKIMLLIVYKQEEKFVENANKIIV